MSTRLQKRIKQRFLTGAMRKLSTFLFCLMAFTFYAQDDQAPEKDALQEFQDIENTLGQLNYFYDSPNRYSEDSAYDWLDVVNASLNNSQKLGDSVEVRHYKFLQAEIYHDLGDFDKSVAIGKDLYSGIDQMDRNLQENLLDLLDRNYGELQFYDKQIETRKEKREMGLTRNIAFYDIYSSLGLHRKAMNDYIMEVKKGIPEDDFYRLAEYHNNVGNYLRLDKSASTAITNLSKAKGFIDVYLNDLSSVKTEKETNDGLLLKAIIEGNIGKSYLYLRDYEDAKSYLERSIQSIEENGLGKYSPEAMENTLALAECEIQLGNLNQAKTYLDGNLYFLVPELEIKKNRLLAAYYDRVGDFRNEAFSSKKMSGYRIH